MNRPIALLSLVLLAPVLAASTTITSDITSDTTWNNAGSPYILDPTGASGGTIKVKSGKTLTIDSTSGAVEIQWNEDCDLQIGNGSGDAGDLVIKAAGGAVTFKIKSGGNVIVNSHGAINFSSTTFRTSFTRYSASAGENNPGALIFDAGQTKQSALTTIDFSYMGYDSQDGALYVKSSATYVPTLNDISFDFCNTSAIRMDGNGINVLKEGNVTLPLSVTNTTYVLYLSAVTSTSSRIVFPDATTPDAASFKLSGTNQVGDSSNPSGWTFLDTCTFKCASSSAVQIVNGYVWGSSEARPTFESDAGSPGYTNWVGLVDDSSTKKNVFGGVGPFAYVTVRNATTGIDINKGTSYVPDSGQRTPWSFPGLVAKKCDTGIRVRTHRETTGVNAGYTTVIENAELGASSSTDDCNAACVFIDHGRAILSSCQINGAVSAGVKIGTVSVTNTYDVEIRDCRLSDTEATQGVLVDSSQGDGAVTLTRSIVEGYKFGVDFYQTSSGGYTPNRTLTMRHSFVSAKPKSRDFSFDPAALKVNVLTAAVCTILVEDSTIARVSAGTTNYGLRLLELRSSSTFLARRTTIDSNTDYGVYIDSATNNTCEYTFEECSITGNGGSGNEAGIRDMRTQTARVVTSHCTFASNTPYNAYDDSGSGSTTYMLAENCYWNSSAGPGATINANVDGSPYLSRPYIGWLIGGSPAGVSALGVNNATGASTYADQLHIIDDDAIAVKWTFASDFNGSTQGAYEIDFDNDSGFGSLTYDGSKTSSSSTDIAITPTIAAGTVYYLRVRMWDANDRAGPWYYHTFRTNSVPAQVGNTNRSHLGGTPTADATPQLVWERPTDADEDPLHFRVEIDDDSGFGSANVTLESSSTGAAFEFSSDSGTTWNPWPSTGAQAGATIRIRCTVPSASALEDGTWYWRVRATDGFENGTWSAEDPMSTQSFELMRSYALAGRLTSDGSTGVGAVGINVYINGNLSATVTTDDGTGGGAAGDFSFALPEGLVPGDILFFFRDGGTSSTRAARLVQFSGENMNDLDLQYERVYVQQTQPDPIVNADFVINAADSDIPWTYSSGAIQFSADLTGSGDGVHVVGAWDMTASVDCTTNNVEFTINSTGTLRTLTYNIDLHKLDNDGTLEVSGGSILTIDNSNSTSSGTLRVYSSTLRLKKAGGITFTVDKGTAEFRNATIDVDTGDVSTLTIDTASTSAGYAVLDCTGTTFSKVGLTVETDGVVAAFNDNIFSGGVSTRHIYWKAEDARTVTTFRGTQFNYALGGGEFNVEATSGALALNLVRSGGARYGEGYDKNGGSESDSLDNKVLWTLMPPLSVATTIGDTRVRVAWTADDQGDLTNAGYNVYRATSESGSYSKINGSLITDAFYNDDNSGGGLTNGTTYWYYVTCIDTNPATDIESGGSPRVSATPAAASISLLTPSTANATSILALTVIGNKTHWDGSATLTVTLGGGSGLTLNDTIVLSSTLMLGDATLSSATADTWTVTAARDNVWSIGAYDESDTENLTVSANANENRPTITASMPALTSGTFTISLSFDANGGDSIDTSTLEMYASRTVVVSYTGYAAGENLAQLPSFWDSIDSTSATVAIAQDAANKLFDNGEYTLWFRIGNTTGKMSERASGIMLVEGLATDVVICTTTLLQGNTMDVTLTGTSLSSSQAIDFGSDIMVNSASGSGSSITVNVTVAHLAACGPRTITTNNGSKSGIAVVDYPTNVYPTTTNAEPSRNPAVGGLNVFLMNGAFFKSETDIATRGRMMGISWSRFYRSDITYNGPLGNGWVGHYFQRCVHNPGSGDIWWYTPDGRKETFPDVSGGFSSPVGVYVSATRETTHNTITLTDRHGYRCVFDSNGRLWRCIDRNGNIVECAYNYAGQLTTITDDRSLTYSIAYQTNGRVDTVTDNVYSLGSPRVVEYEYDSNGDLTEQKAPTTSRYDGTPLPRISYIYRYQSHRLTECVNPNEAAQGGTPASYMENQYEYDSGNSRWQVVAQRLGGQDQWLCLRYVSSTSIRAIDRRGLRTDYTIDGSGRATTVRRYTKIWSVDVDEPITHSTVTEVSGKIRSSDPDYFDTVFTYNANHEVLTVTQPRGNKTTYTYAYSAASQTSGTATSCSANVLTKTSAGWSASAFVGMTLRMGSDASNYRYYAITANTTDTITVDATFSLSGDGWGASAYAVYNLNSDPLAAGNVLTVTRSDEALGSESDLVTTYTYEPRYQFVRTVTNPRSKTTTYTYDYEDSSSTTDAAHGNLVKVAYHSVTSGQPSAQNIVVYMTYDQ